MMLCHFHSFPAARALSLAISTLQQKKRRRLTKEKLLLRQILNHKIFHPEARCNNGALCGYKTCHLWYIQMARPLTYQNLPAPVVLFGAWFAFCAKDDPFVRPVSADSVVAVVLAQANSVLLLLVPSSLQYRILSLSLFPSAWRGPVPAVASLISISLWKINIKRFIFFNFPAHRIYVFTCTVPARPACSVVVAVQKLQKKRPELGVSSVEDVRSGVRQLATSSLLFCFNK